MKKVREVCAYSLFSSSKGNCTYVKSGKDEILIDAGASARAIETSLNALGTSLANIRAIFITHEHTDHIKGLDVISRRFGKPIYAPRKSGEYIAANTLSTSDFLVENDAGAVVEFDEMSIAAYELPHDSLSGVCFRVTLNGTELGYATDVGHLNDGVKTALIGCKNVFIESNHDVDMLINGVYAPPLKRRVLGNYGHLSNKTASEYITYLAQNGAENFVLAHLSAENNRPAIAFAESKGALNGAKISVSREFGESDVRLEVASPCEIIKVI